MKISAAIITYNEEKNIETCLASLVNVVDEIVIVDSYSEDQTQAIAEQYDVRFIQNPFEGHVQQKNFAMQQTTHDYVLSLDGDEALSETLQQQILEVKKLAKPAPAYIMNRMNNYCGQWIRHGGWYPDRKVRLWDKSIGKWGGDNPHDKVILNKGIQPTFIKGDLLHYTIKSVEQHMKQVNYFSSIAAQTAFDKGKRTSILSILINPAFKFIRDYIIRMGFLDGYYGYVIAKNSAFAKYLKYLKLYEIQRSKT